MALRARVWSETVSEEELGFMAAWRKGDVASRTHKKKTAQMVPRRGSKTLQRSTRISSIFDVQPAVEANALGNALLSVAFVRQVKFRVRIIPEVAES